MEYLYLKALHLIFVVTWFSGMFYLCRLFIYNREANDQPQPEKDILQRQFTLMSKRLLYGITWPSAVLTFVFGLWLWWIYFSFPLWLNIKLYLVGLLFMYHLSLHFIYLQQKNKNFKYSSNQLRIWNEVATLFLVTIVMLAVVKQNISLVYGIVGLIALMVILMGAIKIYRRLRNNPG
nr:CopD family protein [Saprospiraceae bacterium]